MLIKSDFVYLIKKFHEIVFLNELHCLRFLCLINKHALPQYMYFVISLSSILY